MYYIQSRFGKFTQIVKSKLGISHSSCQQNFLPASSLSVESPKRLKVVFFGTDLLSIKILAGLHDLTKQGIIQEVCVVTSSSAKKNIRNREQLNNRASEQSQVSIDLDNFRGNQIIDFCSKNNIPCHKWPNIKPNRMYVELLKSYDVGVVASFGHLIPEKLIKLLPHGILNIHPSLLPRWRGASPLIFSVLFGDKQVGVSLMKIQPNFFDIGPVITQKTVDLPFKNTTSFQLLDYLGNIGNLMSFEHLVAHKITSQMFYVDWKDQTCQEIDCQYRALHEINHLKTVLSGKIVKLVDMVRPELINSHEISLCEAGTIKYLKNEQVILVRCKDGFVGFKGLILRQKLTSKDFYNGYLNNRAGVKFESVENSIKQNIFVSKIK